jgi:hypothetical protein
MTDIAFNVTAFRAQFPGFANTGTYPDATLDGYFSFATGYISATPQWGIGGLTLNQQTLALNLMTAHLATIGQRIATYGADSGRVSGFISSESVKDVSYTLKPPEGFSAFGQWLSQTPYGQQLYALLNVASAGGFYVGGLPEGRAFRKLGGRFC